MNKNRRVPPLSRRQVLRAGTVLGAGLVGGARLVPPALAAGRTLAIADVGVGDPGGDWSRFEQPSGDQVNLVSIGNAPSAVVNQLIAGGGQTHLRRDQHRRRHAKAAGRQRSDPRARPEPAVQLAEQHLHRAVSRAGHARLPVHRLRGQDLRRADRAAGRFVRLSAAGDRRAQLLRRAVRSQVQGLRRARGQLYDRRPEDGAVPQALRPGRDQRSGRHDARRRSRP